MNCIICPMGIPTEAPVLNLSIFDGGNPISGSALFSGQLVITDTDLDIEDVFSWDLRSAGLYFDVDDIFIFALMA